MRYYIEMGNTPHDKAQRVLLGFKGALLPYTGPKIIIEFACFGGLSDELAANGWVIETREPTRWHWQRYLYVRHPQMRLCGRCDFPDNDGQVTELQTFNLEFLTHEKNRRYKDIHNVTVKRHDIIEVTQDNVSEALQAIMEVQKKPKPRPRKSNVIELSKLMGRRPFATALAS